MNKYTAALTATLFVCNINTCAETNELLFEAKGEETVRVRLKGDAEEDARTVVEQQKVDFHHVTLWGSNQETPDRQVMVKETRLQVHDHGREGVESSLKVEMFAARENHGKFPSQPTHTLEIPDTNEAHFEDAFWTATTLGCCDAEPYTRMYSYDGQRPFLRYNGDFWKVEVPNARHLDRYIAMVLRDHVPNEEAEKAIFGKHPRAVAAVSLAAPGKLLHTVYLLAKDGTTKGDLAPHTENLEVRGTGPIDEQHPEVRLVTLWSLDGAEPAHEKKGHVGNLTVQAGLYLGDGTTETLRVDIRDDKFVAPRLSGKTLEALLAP